MGLVFYIVVVVMIMIITATWDLDSVVIGRSGLPPNMI